jgi:hypothetical protein
LKEAILTKHEVTVGGSIAPSGTLMADVRTSLTGQFLGAAAMQARAASEMESRPVPGITESDKVMHRGLVVGAIMQAIAALECEIWEVTVHGPGHHLGSNGIDAEAQAFLRPLADTIDKESVLDRYRSVLHLLRKPPLSSGEQPWQDAALVVRLRNELIHYKSRWGQDLDRSRFLRALQAKTEPKPPFIPDGMNFFPYRCLSAACASWGTRSCFALLDSFYARLGFPTRLDPFRQHFTSR